MNIDPNAIISDLGRVLGETQVNLSAQRVGSQVLASALQAEQAKSAALEKELGHERAKVGLLEYTLSGVGGECGEFDPAVA